MTTAKSSVVQQRETELHKKNAADGVALEVPSTRPFEGFTYLKKEWVDHEDNIESVTFSMAMGQLNTPADWNNLQSFTMMPEWGTAPLKRSWVVRIPTHLDGSERYLFHYYFQVRYADGSEKVSDNFTELIMPKNIEYIDHSGCFTHVKMHWSLAGWSYPQDTELEIDGIEWGDEYSVCRSPYRSGDRLFERGRALAVSRIAVPRVFRATIWAPRGEEVNYCFNLVSIDISGNMSQRWDNNCGENFKLTI